MPSTSSLLKSADATRKKIRQQQDAEVAYEWQLSAKTYDDFQAYSKYLKDQSEKTNDPSELLNYRKAVNSARSAYISNDIQRQSIDVIEGRSTNTQKKDAMTRLYYMAADEGNLDLAQSLRLQIDNLDIKIQNEAQAAQNLAGSLASLNANSVEDAVTQLKGFQNELNSLFKEKGTKQFTEEMAQYAQELGVEPGDFFGMHLKIAQEINKVYDDALASDTDPTNQRKFQTAKNNFNKSASIPLPSATGKDMKVTYQDLVDQADAARTGQTLFGTVQTGEGTVFSRNKETGFVWGRTEDGTYRPITVYKPKTDYTSGAYKTQIDSKGNVQYLDAKGQVVATQSKGGEIKGVNGRSIEDAAKRDYKDLLKQGGFNVISAEGDYIKIATPPELLNQGVVSETVILYVNPEGKLQVAGQNDQYYNLEFDSATGEYTGLTKDLPNPITMLNDNFSQDFISKIDKSALPAGAIGIVDTGLASTQLLNVAEFTRGDIENKKQIARIEAARVEEEKRKQADAIQAAALQQQQISRATATSQSTVNPQPSPRINIQVPTASAQKLLPASTKQLQSKGNIGQQLQGDATGGITIKI